MSGFLSKLKSKVSTIKPKKVLAPKRKIYKRLVQLELKKKYNIVRAFRRESEYGPSIMLELEDFEVYLPKRCNSQMDDGDIEGLANLAFEVVAPYGHNSFHIDFHEKENKKQEPSKEQERQQPSTTPENQQIKQQLQQQQEAIAATTTPIEEQEQPQMFSSEEVIFSFNDYYDSQKNLYNSQQKILKKKK
ncbi:uncharacterized protein LOC129905232 [Episyrphus balteatus]|uniref:uncharacterized protein LOC129905232 n=1 Tax=Episyrphus balteatus TaxID=286459 RepID=UPI002486CA42|nr:uncharacterized protein LOC129905232 [Episyrphus balteatus]